MIARRIPIWLTLTALSLCAAGCGLSYLAYGAVPNKTAAKWKPPKEPTLVLVENDRATFGADADCDRVGRYIEQDLKQNDVVPLVEYVRLTKLRDHDPDVYRKMSIAAIGRATGAKQVLYVSLLEYSADTATGSDQMRWKAEVKVKMVDSATGASRWPIDLQEGEPLIVQTDYTATDGGTQSMISSRDGLNKQLATKIGRLFHDWESDFDNPEDYQQQ